MVMVIERLLLGENHRLRRQTLQPWPSACHGTWSPRLQPFCITLLEREVDRDCAGRTSKRRAADGVASLLRMRVRWIHATCPIHTDLRVRHSRVFLRL